jgi:patatin-like phospholipase/acyl hydrolase
LQDAYENDAYLSEGLGSASHVGVNSPKTHSFWPYVDGTVIAADPSTRGPQVPMVIGYSMIIPIRPISKHILTNQLLKINKKAFWIHSLNITASELLKMPRRLNTQHSFAKTLALLLLLWLKSTILYLSSKP